MQNRGWREPVKPFPSKGAIWVTVWGYPLHSKGFSSSSDGKEYTCNAGDPSLRLQSLGQEDPLEKGTATHSSILAWRIPWTEEPGGLQSMWPWRVRHDWVTVRGLCSFLSSVLLQQKFEVMGQCYSSVTAQFYLASKGKYILEAWGWANPKEVGGSILAPLLIYFFPSPWACPMTARLARRTVCFSRGSQTFLCSIFVLFLSLSFSPCYFGPPFPLLTTSHD